MHFVGRFVSQHTSRRCRSQVLYHKIDRMISFIALSRDNGTMINAILFIRGF